VSAIDPFAGALLRARVALGHQPDAQELFAYWRSRAPGNPRSEMRYRWELTHRRGVPMPTFAPSDERWTAWRPAEEPMVRRDPFEFEERLGTPIIVTDNGELLAEAARRGSSAAELLDEALPVMRRDFAAFVQAADPWQDTFALFCLVRKPRLFARLHPLAVAIATNYAAGSRGVVHGTSFPFHRQPLVSATAQLASGLLALGSDLELVASLVEYVASARLPDGGWADASDKSDVLTTLVAADLLAHTDPGFDAGPTRALFSWLQGDDGLWRGLGPEAPWLTLEILELVASLERPFAERFRFPFLPDTNRDHKTKLPFFAYFADLARLFAALSGLSATRTDLAFIDLIGFRAFNNAYGQERGDEVLRAFADALGTLPAARPIRDGGDEFLVVGQGVPPVAPRILIARARAGALAKARERLGRDITSLKDRAGPNDPQGLLVDVGEI
jgi:GGDEF domain-containing protein